MWYCFCLWAVLCLMFCIGAYMDCKQSRAKNKRYKRALKIAVDYLKEWESWFDDMGKHQYYDLRNKIIEIEQILK